MPSPIKVEDGVIVYSEETTQGTSVTPSEKFSPIQGEVTLPDPEYAFDYEYFVGAGQLPADKFSGQEELTGGTLPFRIVQPYELYLLLGTMDNPSTGVYELSVKESDLPPSISLGVAMDGFTRVFNSCVASSGEITVSNDEQLALDLDFDALGVSTTETITEPSGDNWASGETHSFQSTASNLTIASQSFARLTDMSIEINRNTSVEYYVEDGDGAYEILYGRPEITQSATIKVTDDSIYQELLDGSTKFESNIVFENSTSKIDITLHDCNIRSAPHNVPEEGAMEVEVEIAAEDISITFTDKTV